jgi:hypothetical protein
MPLDVSTFVTQANTQPSSAMRAADKQPGLTASHKHEEGTKRFPLFTQFQDSGRNQDVFGSLQRAVMAMDTWGGGGGGGG